jgi:uncharacterized protein
MEELDSRHPPPGTSDSTGWSLLVISPERVPPCNAKKMSIDRDGRSELHYAPQHKPEGEQKALAQRLISEGCDVDLQDARGWSPLHFAAQEWSAPVAAILIEMGAAVDLQNENGNTAVFNAVFNSRGRGELIRILIEAGADPDIENAYGMSPRELANTIANFNVKQHIPAKE